ncbi:unnamed protein product [Clonostachys rhizophaga]|uniref:N-acetyltransferase domain-containing protein n=1 Tax=Clonostachys rhizophaga TaxID=160324 RepID=A0A9N9VR57_9HYPO|nr:unnamed protein product [Clonostachys rhizophaga]
MDPVEAKRWSTIKTTLPRLPPNSERETTTTSRLELRPLKNNSHDLAALHALRTDEKVMRWSPQGVVDADLKETLGWPEVSFGIKSDHWGQGYASEFLEGFLGIWRRLPRRVVVTRVHVSTVYSDREIVDECVAGIPTYDNVACHRVLEKSGFEKRVDWEVYNYRREERERLYGWVMTKSNAQLLEEQLSALQIT